MRIAEVQSRFLQDFGRLYPQFRFRGIRHFRAHTHAPYQFALGLSFGASEFDLDLACVTLGAGDLQEVRRVLQQIAEADTDWLGERGMTVLVSPLFGPEAQRLCLESGVGFFDLVGNAGLQTEHIYIDIHAKEEDLPRKRLIQTPFEGKSERVVRRLLLSPERVWRMRELAEEARVSLGLASMTTSTLAQMGGVVKGRFGLSVLDPGLLLDNWAKTYDLRRSPFRTLRSDKDPELLELDLGRLAAGLRLPHALTLWSGAHRLLELDDARTHLAVYWPGDFDALAQALRLSPDRGRTVAFVFRAYDEAVFWGGRRFPGGVVTAHPLQVYLDLGSGDAREIQLAYRLRETLLDW